MNLTNKFFAVVEAGLWYLFAYYALYAVRNPISIGKSALILIALAYGASVACPLIRNSSGWRRTWGSR
jgi:hypothetical protein